MPTTKAAAVTERVEIHIKRALRALNGGSTERLVDELGIYSDPGNLQDVLFETRSAVDAALQEMTSISWPTTTEYNAAKRRP